MVSPLRNWSQAGIGTTALASIGIGHMPTKRIADVLNYSAICLAGHFDDKPKTIITFGTFGLTIDHVRGFIAGGC